MYNMFCLEISPCCYNRLACLTSANLYAFLKDLWSSSTVDCSVNTATAAQAFIGSIHNCIGFLLCYIAFNQR